MKILVVNTIDYGINGIASVVVNFCQTIAQLDSNTHIDVLSHGYIYPEYKKIFEQNNICVKTVCARKKMFKYMRQLKEIAKTNKYDIVHIHGNSSTMLLETTALKKCGAKIVVHCHTTKCKHAIIHKLLKAKFNKTYDYALACSAEAGKFCFTKPFEIIDNPLDIKKFLFNIKARETIRKQYQLQNKVVCLHVGLFNKQKNQEFLVRVAKLLPQNYVIMFVGGGHTLNKIKKLAKKQNITNVIFAGLIKDVKDYYSAADMFVFPSIFESFGLALVEAQLCGLKCIISDQVSKHSKVLDNLVCYLPLDEQVWQQKITKTKFDGNREVDTTNFEKFTSVCASKKLLNYYREITK